MKKIVLKLAQTKMTMMVIIAFLILPGIVLAFSADHDFPRTLAWQLNTGKSDPSELARYDAVILNMNAHQTHPELFDRIRQLNPEVAILAYTSGVEYPKFRLNDVEPSGRGVWHDLGRGIRPEWYLKTTDGSQVSFWHEHVAMNPSRRASNGQTYADYVGNFLVDNVLASGKWDGLFFDTTWDTISWHDENIDINGDGKKDSPEFIDRKWHEGQEEIFSTIRSRVGGDYFVITNGDGRFSNVNNGRMFESFPEFYEGGWVGSVQRYFSTDGEGLDPRFNIINADTDNSGNFRNYRMMRFGLASTLLGNGYYNFDYGTQDRSHVEYYDEYSVSLGRPIRGAVNLLLAASQEVAPGLWQRDFENGISLVNSTPSTRTLVLPGEYEKLNGTQDPYVNDGRVVNKVSIPSRDGLLLLRPLQEVVGDVFENGAFTRIFTADSRRVRASFFSYDERFSGSQNLLKHDVDGDGRIETLAADESSITIYADNGSIKTRFYPYTAAFRGGINFGIGDLNGDNTQEIVTGTGRGGGPQIRIFNSEGRLINPGFFAYATNFRGGVHVAVGDLNGDKINEIIAGAGFGGGPHIRVFNKDGHLINPGFFAYNPAFRGGVNVASGDIDGDGIDEIISGPGRTGGPHVRIWNQNGQIIGQFMAFNPTSNQGVRVAAYDFDGDRRDEIVAMTTDFFSLGN